MNILDELKQRGIFNNITNEQKFNSLRKKVGIYIGFDPTATSLHLGNYLQIVTLLRFKAFGFNPIALIGGATGMIGDPSGKSSERNLLDEKKLLKNKVAIKKQLESFLLTTFDNFDIYQKMNVLDFLRGPGKLLNVSYMINKEVVSSRLETGISFTEFSYQLIQGWDFRTLYNQNNVRIQVGGSDQWGNITAGVELIRKTIGDDNQAIGITTNLLTTTSGKKFGKSEGNAIWLDKKLTSPFALYQYLLNTPDEDVKKILLWTTFLSIDEIKQLMSKHQKEPFKRLAQKTLAFNLVKDIHSEEDANIAIKLSDVLFGKISSQELKINEIKQLNGAIPTFENIDGNILEVLKTINATQSNRESREFIEKGSIEVNGIKIEDESFEVKPGYENKFTLIKRGKKNFYLIKY